MSDDIASAPADVSPGDKIAGYRLEEQIGQGGMAVVYRAHDERLDRRVALKLLAPGLAADTAFRARFIRESRAAAAVDHPNVIPVYDAGDAGGFLFISMRYVQGGDVRSLLKDGQPLPPARAWNIINQVAAALDAAHAQDLIHRDVKPANMLLDAGGWTNAPQRGDAVGEGHDHVYLSDFGISKQTFASNLTSTGQFVGTLDYIAPEQIEGHPIDGRTDLYSLACAAFEMLCGSPPFRRSLGLALINAHLSEQAPSLVAQRPELPASVDLVMAKAMAKSPAQRYATCSQFATDLGRALGLVPGALEAGAPPPVGAVADIGGQAQPWPATELAGPASGPGAHGAATPPHSPAVDPETMLAGQGGPSGPQVLAGTPAPTMQQGPPGPTGQQWPAGTGPIGGQPGPYGQYQNYPPAGGPGGPGWPAYPPQQPPRRSRGLLAGVVVAVVAIAAAAVAVTVVLIHPGKGGNGNSSISSPPASSSSSSTPPSTALTEATAVSNLLSSSAQSRQAWNSNVLINDVGACINIASDVNQIQQIANQRSSEYNDAKTLQTDAIQNGGLLKSQLMQALLISLNIDNDYLAWAQQQQNSGCTVGTNSTYYQQATAMDSQATSDKDAFVQTWNPIAQQYGLEQFSAGQI